MSEVGFIGLGKLGLPVALAIESRGHHVIGTDINPAIETYIEERHYPFQEEGVDELLRTTKLELAFDIGEVVAKSDIIFLPVQTPHEARFEGTTRLPEDRADFDYTYLKEAVREVADTAKELGKHTVLAVISTCLPGTYDREIRPLLNDYVDYVYTPQFIAMGTVVDDYLKPEFALIGAEDKDSDGVNQLRDLYETIHDKPHVVTDITTAEGIKVSYNTWITAKTVIANAWGEMAEKTGMNFDDIHKAWTLATDRLISPKYMNAGMSDGGGCHPRDNIAMSHIADEVGMSYNIWEDLMAAREEFEHWHARVAMDYSQNYELPLVIMGRSFKPETKIETGSPALLMKNIIDDYGYPVQHFEDLAGMPQVAVYFIGTQHERYKDIRFPQGSIVIDPFGYLEEQTGVKLVKLGRNVV